MLLLRNGTIVDGTGSASYPGSLLIDGERIEAGGELDFPSETETLDCSGLIIAPGFIDAHSHSDLQVLENHRAKANQGVTTEVVGNCGFSAYPYIGDRKELHRFADGILYGHHRNWGWSTSREYLEEVERDAKLAHIQSLVGHGSLRVAYMGQRQGMPDAKELDGMKGMLAECLQEGSCGFSTGLMYAPGSSAPWEELVELCKVVAKAGKIYATHMRNYSNDLIGSLEEQLLLATESGVRLQISHLQAVGRSNWEKQERALALLETARDRGIDVEFDSYPYLAGSTVLTQLLPQSAMDGGIEGLLARLRGNGTRRDIARVTVDEMAQQWSDILIASVGSKHNRRLVGLSIEEIAKERGCEGIDAALDLLIEEEGLVNILSFNQSEDNLRKLLTHPLCTVISDGFYVKGRPHPRLYGTFPCLLGEIVRKRGWLSLPEAIHKVTGKPATRFGMDKRGVLTRGAVADITVFDPVEVEGRATYSSPEVPPLGIRHVLKSGRQITPCESKN